MNKEKNRFDETLNIITSIISKYKKETSLHFECLDIAVLIKDLESEVKKMKILYEGLESEVKKLKILYEDLE